MSPSVVCSVGDAASRWNLLERTDWRPKPRTKTTRRTASSIRFVGGRPQAPARFGAGYPPPYSGLIPHEEQPAALLTRPREGDVYGDVFVPRSGLRLHPQRQGYRALPPWARAAPIFILVSRSQAISVSLWLYTGRRHVMWIRPYQAFSCERNVRRSYQSRSLRYPVVFSTCDRHGHIHCFPVASMRLPPETEVV